MYSVTDSVTVLQCIFTDGIISWIRFYGKDVITENFNNIKSKYCVWREGGGLRSLTVQFYRRKSSSYSIIFDMSVVIW